MPKTNKSIATFAILAGAGFLLATLFVFVAPMRPLQPAQAVVQASANEEVIAQFPNTSPEDYVSETGKSAVKATMASEKVTAKRGTAVAIEVLANHLGGANADQTVNVKVLPPIGYTLYPPSVAKSTTPEERFEAALAGTPLPGGIDLGALVTVQGPSEKAVSKASQQAYTIMINLPKDLPDELDEIFIPINVKAMDSSGNEVPAKGTGVTVVVSQ